MKSFDLHVHSAFSEGESTVEELAKRAEELGYSAICFSEYYESESQMEELYSEISKVRDKSKVKVFLGFEARNTKEIKKLRDIRRKFDILLVHGGDLKVNRAAVETKEVDILTHPEHGRYDSGINHVMAKLAKKNDVCIELNFREVIISNKKTRSVVLSNMRDNIDLAEKYGMPIILCSGAISHWEMKDPFCIVSLAESLGMGVKDAKDSISKTPERILELVKERRGEDWIMPGVKKE